MPDQPSITCPNCGRTSYNPHDIAFGYCGACHHFNSHPLLDVGIAVVGVNGPSAPRPLSLSGQHDVWQWWKWYSQPVHSGPAAPLPPTPLVCPHCALRHPPGQHRRDRQDRRHPWREVYGADPSPPEPGTQEWEQQQRDRGLDWCARCQQWHQSPLHWLPPPRRGEL